MDEFNVTPGMEEVCGELTAVVRVALVDANGHPHEFTLAVEDADELAAQLAEAVAV